MIAPGTYPGGVTVGVSVSIVGAWAGATIIKGGAPVLTLWRGERTDDLDRRRGGDRWCQHRRRPVHVRGRPPWAPGVNTAALGVGFSDFCVCGQTLVLKDSVISGNRTTAIGGDSSSAANVLEIDVPATVT